MQRAVRPSNASRRSPKGNNSAWNERHFVIESTEEWSEALLQREVAFVETRLAQDGDNESAWNYLGGCAALSAACVQQGSAGQPLTDRRLTRKPAFPACGPLVSKVEVRMRRA